MSATAGVVAAGGLTETTNVWASASTPPGADREPATTPKDSIAITASEATRGVGSWRGNGGRGSGSGSGTTTTGAVRISNRVDSTDAGSGPRRVPQRMQ